jgi:serine/threonine-protein kinase
MEYIDGINLHEYLEQNKNLSFDAILPFMLQICDAICFMHGKNIIHCDLKPSNIMLLKRNGVHDFVKILDFGLARIETLDSISKNRSPLGTLYYMCPENIIRGEFSCSCDIYSLGVIFYELISGIRPFDGDVLSKIIEQKLNKTYFSLKRINNQVPAEISNMIDRMISQYPDERPDISMVLSILKKYYTESQTLAI